MAVITCRHCESVIKPKKRNPAGAWLLAIGLIFGALFVAWPFLLVAWVPILWYRHSCPKCGLWLD